LPEIGQNCREHQYPAVVSTPKPFAPRTTKLHYIYKSIILAAGRGTRLGALTADRPKPLVEVRGKPVLEHIILGLKGCGICRFLLVIGYLGDRIREYCGDGARFGVNVEYVHQPAMNGTGAATLLGREFAGSDPFVMSFGDILTDTAHYQALLEMFETHSCAAVLGINPVDDPYAGGAVYRDGERVIKVIEKPPRGTAGSNWNLAGVNVFSPAIFDALEHVPPSARGEIEITDGIQAMISQGLEVRASELHGFWSDIGTLEALAEAERSFKSDG
jgi:dTDP-glucose pyrophosphorylase